MKLSIQKGLGFGLTSGIITTLGLMIGLAATTSSKTIVISGILIIALSDSLSDALGMHISEETANHKTQKSVWESTIATFCSKLIFACSFIAPVAIFSLPIALIISIIWGTSLISLFSYQIEKSFKTVIEHLFITILVIISTYLVGLWVNSIFLL